LKETVPKARLISQLTVECLNPAEQSALIYLLRRLSGKADNRLCRATRRTHSAEIAQRILPGCPPEILLLRQGPAYGSGLLHC
jgi:hypothetical protein